MQGERQVLVLVLLALISVPASLSGKSELKKGRTTRAPPKQPKPWSLPSLPRWPGLPKLSREPTRAAPSEPKATRTIGALCNTHYDCAGLSNSECISNVCTCRDSFVAHSSGKECLKVAAMHMSTCEEHGQCVSSFGDFMECKDSKCLCIPMHRFNIKKHMCVKFNLLEERCVDSEDCYVSDDDKQNRRVACISNRCQCKKEYHITLDQKTCTAEATRLGEISWFTSIAIILALRMFN